MSGFSSSSWANAAAPPADDHAATGAEGDVHGVLAVEAYHAGLIRTVLFATNVAPGNFNYKATAGISNLRRALSGANDDQGIGPDQSTIAGGQATLSNIVPTGANGVAFARNPRQVLNSVYGAPNAHSGLFFPNGLNVNALSPPNVFN